MTNSSKTSQHTEMDMNESTFRQYDTGVDTGDASVATMATRGVESSSSAGGAKSNNAKIILGVSVAAVIGAGYLFAIKPMLNKASAPAPQAQAPAPVETNLPPEQIQVTQPGEIPGEPSVNLTPSVIPEQPPQINVAEMQPPVVPQPVEPPVAPSQPVVVPPATTAPVVTIPSGAVADDLKAAFDKKGDEFRGLIQSIDQRVGAVESEIRSQRDFNAQVDARLTALENGKVAKVTAPSAGADAAKPAKKQTKKKVARKAAPAKAAAGGDILVDNRGEGEVIHSSSAKQQGPRMEVHSVYGKRVWIKNEDGSLSTFSVGDKLPSGEVIRGINDESHEVITNKRTIRH